MRIKDVTPHVGVWIETKSDKQTKNETTSHLM